MLVLSQRCAVIGLSAELFATLGAGLLVGVVGRFTVLGREGAEPATLSG